METTEQIVKLCDCFTIERRRSVFRLLAQYGQLMNFYTLAEVVCAAALCCTSPKPRRKRGKKDLERERDFQALSQVVTVDDWVRVPVPDLLLAAFRDPLYCETGWASPSYQMGGRE